MVKYKKRGTKKRRNDKKKATTQKGGLFKDGKQYLMVTLDDPSISDYDTAKMMGVDFNLTLGSTYLTAAMDAVNKDLKDKKIVAAQYFTHDESKDAKMARAAVVKAIAAVESVKRWVSGKPLQGQIERSGENNGDPIPIIPYDKVKERADVTVTLQKKSDYINESLCKIRDMGLRLSNLGLRSKTKDPRYKSALDYVLKRNKLITLKLLLKCELLNCPNIDIVSAINHRLYNILKGLNDITCIEQFNMFKVELEYFNTMIIVIVNEILNGQSELRKLAVYLDKRLKQLLQNHTTVPMELLEFMSKLLISPEGLYTLIYKNLEDKSNILLPRPELATALPEGWDRVQDDEGFTWYEKDGKSQWHSPVDSHMGRIEAAMQKSAPFPNCSQNEIAQYSSPGVIDSVSGAAITYTFTAPAAGALAGGGDLDFGNCIMQ